MLLAGRNKDTNKKSELNIDDNGNLKIDESGKLTEIKTSIDTLYNYTINNDLRYFRSQGKCYTTSFNYVGTAETQKMLSLWNPVGSGKILYLYRLNAQFDNDGASDYATRLILYGTSTQPTAGTLQTPINLSLGNNNLSSVEARTGYTHGGNFVITHLLTADEPGATQNVNIEYKEYIQIPEGMGIFTILYMTTSTNKMRAMNSLYYIETSSNVPS